MLFYQNLSTGLSGDEQVGQEAALKRTKKDSKSKIKNTEIGSRAVHSVDERGVLDICIPVINNLSTNSSLSEKEGL
jgi:hypothetical protein